MNPKRKDSTDDYVSAGKKTFISSTDKLALQSAKTGRFATKGGEKPPVGRNFALRHVRCGQRDG